MTNQRKFWVKQEAEKIVQVNVYSPNSNAEPEPEGEPESEGEPEPEGMYFGIFFTLAHETFIQLYPLL